MSYGVNIEEDAAVTSCSDSHVVIDTDVEVADDETRKGVLPLIEESSASTSDQVSGDV